MESFVHWVQVFQHFLTHQITMFLHDERQFLKSQTGNLD
ncbi:hypothetical protein J567_4477, partial [Acinetobacter baumannii 754286]